MATRRTTFDKLQRERAKKAKAAAKREARQTRGDEEGGERDDDLELSADEELTPGELLQRIEAVHERYAAGTLSFEDFEEQKTDLLTRLSLLPIE
ncbi:MAG: hypothetical protein JWL83_4190 [Actinomycetia bacterium]|nr:hypothetical protein [Actinomycetes bacterium]